MTEDNRLYRPSASDKIALCAHFESSEQETDATRYGRKIHELIAHCLQHPKEHMNRLWLAANSASDEEVNLVLDACNTAIAEIGDIRGVEDQIHIYDVTEEEITWGTCDVWGYRNGRLKLLDWKTGEDHGYDHQMNHYALGLMDREKQADCEVSIIYLNKNKPTRIAVTYQHAADVVAETYERVLAKDSLPHQINDYCGWCALKGHGCPAWENEQAIATAPEDAAPILRDNMMEILNDPDKLGRFIVAFRAFTSLYEDMKFEAVAKDMLQSGNKVPGLMTYDRAGKETVDPEQFLQVVVKAMGAMRSSTCITVSAKKAQEAWATFSKEPFPIPVVPGPTIKVLKENRKELPQ